MTLLYWKDIFRSVMGLGEKEIKCAASILKNKNASPCTDEYINRDVHIWINRLLRIRRIG